MASRSWVGEPAGDIPAASSPFPAWRAAGTARAAVRSSALAPPPSVLTRAGRFGSAPRRVSAGLRARRRIQTFPGRGEEEVGGGRETLRAGVGSSRMEELGRGARGVGSGCGRLGQPRRALPGLGVGDPWEVPTPRPAVLRAKSLPHWRTGPQCSPAPSFGSPPPALESQRHGDPRPSRGFAPPPRAPTRRGPCCSGQEGRGARRWDWETEGPVRPWPLRSFSQLRDLASLSQPPEFLSAFLPAPFPPGVLFCP